MVHVPDESAVRPVRARSWHFGPLRREPTPPAAVKACLSALEEAFAWECTVARRMNSRIHRARCDASAIAIKECFDYATRQIDSGSAERQFVALTRVANAARIRGKRTISPLPLLLCAEHGAYAMTWMDGKSATRLLLACNEPREAARLGAAAGAWLRAFHALRPLPPRPSDFLNKIEFVNRMRNSSDRLVARCSDALAECATAAAAMELPASWIHGDMKADNLLVDGERVIGLDFQLANENTVVYDLAPFVNHLRLLEWSVRGLARERIMRMAIGSFLDTYSAATSDWSLPIAWTRAYLLLQVATRSATLPRRIANWPVRRELAHVIDALA